MVATKSLIQIKHDSVTPKYQQIVNAINNAIGKDILQKGDLLPSVNKICKEFSLSRDTVFKAYAILKDSNRVVAVPNKGYYVANETKKVLLILDTFKAYKEVLYDAFINNLPDNVITDVQFHHYNINNFKTIVNTSIGKYYKYVIMNFNHVDVKHTLAKFNTENVLLIDWNIYAKEDSNFVFQDFGQSFYNAILEAKTQFRNYKRIDLLFPDFTYHPKETIHFFNKFCEDYNFKSKICTDYKNFKIEKNIAYVSVSDRMLGKFLEQCKSNNLEPGKDIGFLSYNETPMKKFIYKGISVVSTDFKELGTKAAEFVTKNTNLRCYIPTKLTLRESL